VSLVTRCPACATAFKVVRDQLRISDGWVRCGRCSQVFDATLDLHDESQDGAGEPEAFSPEASWPAQADADPALPAEHALPPPVETPAPMPAIAWPDAKLLDLAPAPVPVVAPPPASVEPPLPWPAMPSLDIGRADGPAPEDQAPQEARDAAPEPASPSPVEAAVDAQLQKALRRERIKALKQAKARRQQEAAQAAAAPAEDAPPIVQAASEAALETPSPAAEPPPWMASVAAAPQRRAMRRGLVALAAVAALALALQVLRHERDAVAAAQPGLRPLLSSLCSVSGCTLSPLRQLDAIKIDSSSFVRDGAEGGYRLAFTLRNAAAEPLVMPAIELSLLDRTERAVVRRVFLPAEFGAPPLLAARGERSVMLPLALRADDEVLAASIVGFTMFAFYP